MQTPEGLEYDADQYPGGLLEYDSSDFQFQDRSSLCSRRLEPFSDWDSQAIRTMWRSMATTKLPRADTALSDVRQSSPFVVPKAKLMVLCIKQELPTIRSDARDWIDDGTAEDALHLLRSVSCAMGVLHCTI